MKDVFTTPMCAHVWAQQGECTYGKNNGGALYFRDRAIFSFRDSWPLAVFAKERKDIVFINRDRYGPRTAGHASRVWRAVHDRVTMADIGLKGLRRYLDGESSYGEAAALAVSCKLDKTLANAKRLSNPNARLWGIRRVEDGLSARLEAFDGDLGKIEDFAAKLAVELTTSQKQGLASARVAIEAAFTPEKIEARRKAAIKRDIKRQPGISMQYLKAEQNALFHRLHPCAAGAVLSRRWRANVFDKSLTPLDWQDGKKGRCWAGDGPTLLRRKGDECETSRGATVPWEAAKFVFRFAQICVMEGKGQVVREASIGMFRGIACDKNGDTTIGCHKLTWGEMLRLARREAPEIVKVRYPVPAVVWAFKAPL